MKPELKFKLQQFADPVFGSTSTETRVDVNAVTEEGVTVAETVTLALHENTWLVPGKTFTRRTGGGAGTDYITILTRKKNGKPTGLGVDADTGEVQSRRVPIRVEKKVSAQVDGIFVTAGIANMEFERAVNEGRLRIMAEDYRQSHLDLMTLKATKTAVDATVYENPVHYLVDLQKEYHIRNAEQATAAIVSINFFYEIDKFIVDRPTAMGDTYVSTAYKGKIKDLEIYVGEHTQTQDAFLITPFAFHIKRPAMVAEIGESAISGVNMNMAEFDGGLLTMHETRGKAGVVDTWLHYFYGHLIPEPKLMTQTITKFVLPTTPSGAGK